MEITVSKFDLLKELTATQGVVERKTTIPILSHFLFEAADDKLSITATDLDLGLRTSCPAKVKKEGACTIPARKLYDYVKLLARRRHQHQGPREPLGQYSLWPVQHKDGRHGAVELSCAAYIPKRRRDQDSRPGFADDDCEDNLRDLQ